MDYNSLSLIPPILAIVLAIVSKDVVLSLLTGLFAGYLIINGFNPATAFTSLFDGIIGLFAEGWITKTLIFALLVGSIVRLIVDSGGVNGFVRFLTEKSKLIQSKRSSLLLAYIIGLIIFIESSITSLLSGTVARPLTDRFGVSRQKLAYVCDSTSAPVCSLLAFNGWGALLIGLITAQITAGVINGNAVSIFVHSVVFNFYAIIALTLVLIVILKDWNIGSMKDFERRATPTQDYDHSESANEPIASPWKMLLPLAVLVTSMPITLYLTGDGNILNGSGSTSVFYAVIVCLIFTFIYYMLTRAMRKAAFFESFYKGIADMMPIVLILLLAFAISKMTQELGTGTYLATLAKTFLSPSLIPVIIFILSSIIAFSTGTSWGTFSIMMPIAIGMAVSTENHIPLVIGAVVSGGIFGDHASPISDTTIISSLAAKSDHIEHVTTQLPYALIGAALAASLFILFGFLY